jgi:feruloyl-CoA synthase
MTANPPSQIPHEAANPERLFGNALIRRTYRADGSIVLDSAEPLGPHPRCVTEHLVHWAREAPNRAYLLERSDDGSWSGATYQSALARVERLAGALLEMGTSPSRPLAILCDNSVEHGLLTLAAMHVGIPVAPISPAYSLVSSDFQKLKSIIRLLTPAVIYVDDFVRYAPALEAIQTLHTGIVVASTRRDRSVPDVRQLSDLDRDNLTAVRRAFEAVTPDTVAKVLFTSGSTDAPKGVINTHRMLCANQQAKAQVWPFLETHVPVLVDWLPWNHTFGGNHNFNLVLRNGGTLYIDRGRPLPLQFSHTLANLSEVAPTIYFNVPRGFEMLVPALQDQRALREKFFSRLKLLFYAAASLPQHLWDALNELSASACGKPIPLVSAWGSTETAPLATDCYGEPSGPGVIGVPVPGCELKLEPNGEKLEVSVRGANVFPGYWRRPDLTMRTFDEEGFYRIGDAVRFADESAPERGLLFDGRVAEDFKLTTGTWVSVGELRLRAIAAMVPIAQDVVVAGHDRSEVRVLVFPNIGACRKLCPDLGLNAGPSEIVAHSRVREIVAAGLKSLHDESPATSSHATGALLLTEPPSIDAGEITDKGYINQRAVLNRRKDLAEALFREGHAAVVSLRK